MSPYCLIQEHVWPNEWLILVSCVLLNCTRRVQVEQVFDAFTKVMDTPERLLEVDKEILRDRISPLGLSVRRAKVLQDLARAYIKWDHVDAFTLPGIGDYGARAWRIFAKNELGDDEPNDGALKLYWNWRLNLNETTRKEPKDDKGRPSGRDDAEKGIEKS